MSTFQAQLSTFLSVTKTFDATDSPSADQAGFKHNAFNSSTALNASSDPTLTGFAVATGPLVAGAYTIDLTSVSGGNQNTVNMTGKKMLGFLFNNPAGNASMTLFGAGVSNPYEPFGAGNDITIPGGGRVLAYFDDELAAVGSGAKNISVAGTGTQSFQFEAIFGDD